MTIDMVGRIDECFLLSYAVDPERAATLVPAGLDLITHRGCAFLNIVVCRIERMRPRLVPNALGLTYWHVAYRLHVSATISRGISIEGLYFLRSDVDRPLFGAIGNRLTDFKFHRSRVTFRSAGQGWALTVIDPCGVGSAIMRARPTINPPRCGLFPSIEERERVLKYAPFGLSVSRSGQHVRVAEVQRDERMWKEMPVAVEAAQWRFPESLGLHTGELARATRVSPIDYRWRIGRTGLLCYRSGLPQKEGRCLQPSPRRPI